MREFYGITISGVTQITSRHKEVLRLIGAGKTNKEIGIILCCSIETVKNHIYDIMRLLYASDRTHAVILAIQNGYISLDEIETK